MFQRRPLERVVPDYGKTVRVNLARHDLVKGGESGFIVFTFTPADSSSGAGYADDLQVIYRDQTGEEVITP